MGTSYRTIRARRYSFAKRTWSKASAVPSTTRSVYVHGFAMTSTGHVMAMWGEQHGVIYRAGAARWLAGTSAWSKPWIVSDTPNKHALAPALAVASSGDALVGWRIGQAPSAAVKTRRFRSNSGVWDSTVVLSSLSGTTQGPFVFTRGQHLTAAWGGLDASKKPWIRVADMAPSKGSWSKPQELAAPHAHAASGNGVWDFAAGPNGSAMVTWVAHKNGKYELQARYRPSLSAPWSDPAVLQSALAAHADGYVRLGFSSAGDVLAAGWMGKSQQIWTSQFNAKKATWTPAWGSGKYGRVVDLRLDKSGRAQMLRIIYQGLSIYHTRANHYDPATKSWDQDSTHALCSTEAKMSHPSVAADGQGNAIVVWSHNGTLYARVYR